MHLGFLRLKYFAWARREKCIKKGRGGPFLVAKNRLAWESRS